MNDVKGRAFLKEVARRQYPCRQCGAAPNVTASRDPLDDPRHATMVVTFACHGERYDVPWEWGDGLPRHPWGGPADTDELPPELQGIL